MPRKFKPPSPFRYFNSSPEVIRLVVMMYVKYPLSRYCQIYGAATSQSVYPIHRRAIVPVMITV